MSVKVSATVLLIDCMLVASTGDFCFRCNGLYGQVSFDSKDDQKVDAKYKEAIKGNLPENLSVVDVKCCLFNRDFGLVFSSSVIETDYFWKCTQIPLGQQIRQYQPDGYDASKWENAQVIQNFFEDPTAVVRYDESQNSGLRKFFGKNSKWIWATVNGTVPMYDSHNRFCVYCKGHTKNYVPRELFGWLSSASKEGLQLFGTNYKEFKLAFELLPPSWNNGSCAGARVTMIITPGHKSLIAIFGTETDLVSQLWQCTSSEIGSSCVRLSEVSMFPLKCHVFSVVWIVIRSGGHLSLGVGRVLHKNVGILVKLRSGYEKIRELRVDHASNQKQKHKNYIAKLRIYRSLKDNRCIFHEDELSLFQPCGDGYITDETLCLECGCCFYPAHLLRHHVTKDYVACYRPMSMLEHSGHEAYVPSCNRSFRDIIKNVSLAIRPSGKIKLFENVTFVIAVQDMPANVRVELKFGDGSMENNIALVKNAQIPDWASVVYSGDFYFGTVVHQYTLQAPFASGSLRDCLQKSCTGYFATLGVFGRDGERIEVVQFVEGGDVPFEAKIFTRREPKRGNMTICAVVSKLEVPISLMQAWMEFDGSSVNVSLEQNLNVPAWLSSHYEPDDYAVILNHVFNTKASAVIKLHFLLPNAVLYTVEAPWAESFQDQIGYYDVITDPKKKSFFNLYENVTFLLRIQTATDAVAALSFGDGKMLQNIKLSRNVSSEDIPEWAAPFSQDSSLSKTLVFHQFMIPGQYAVRLKISDMLNSSNALFNETVVHVNSFAKSLGKVVLIGNTSGTFDPYDTVAFIVLVENIVSGAQAVLKLDEDSASLYTRFTRSSKVEYEGVWYNAVTVKYAFYKPGRHNVTLTIKDGYNSSNQMSSVITTEIMVNRIQDAIGEVGLYLDESKLNLINTNVEFFVLVQRHFRHMRLHASMGDGHTVDFIHVNVKQQPPLWMKMAPSKSFYLKGGFSHAYSSAGTYLVQAVAEDSLKSRPDYSTALIKVIVQHPLPDTLTVADKDYTMEITDAVEIPDDDSIVSGMDFTAASMYQSHTMALERTDTIKGFRSETSAEGLTTASKQDILKGNDSKTSKLEGGFSQTGYSVTSKYPQDRLKETDVGEKRSFSAAGVDQMSTLKGTGTSPERDLEGKVPDVGPTVITLKGGSYTSEKIYEFKSDFSDKKSSTASIDQRYSQKGTENHTFDTGFSVSDYGGEIYSSAVSGTSVEALHPGVDLHKTTVDPENSFRSASNGDSGENQKQVNDIKPDTFGDLDTFDSTLNGSAEDWNTTFSAQSYAKTCDNHSYISEDDLLRGEKYTKKVHSPDSFVATVDSTTGSERETVTDSESSKNKTKDGGKMHATMSIEEQDVERQKVAELTHSVTADEEKATKVYKTVTSDKKSLGTTTERHDTKKVFDELIVGGKETTSEISFQSAKSQDVSRLKNISSGFEEETGLPGSKTASPAVPEIKSIVPDERITPSETKLVNLSTIKLKEITPGLAKGTEIASSSVPGFKSITPRLDKKISTADSKTVDPNTQLKSIFGSDKGTGFPDTRPTSLNIPILKSTDSGSEKEMVVGDTDRKPFETTLQHDVERKSSPYADQCHVVVYVASSGIVSFLVLLENVTENLRGGVLFGDNRSENFTFDRLTSYFPDWLLEMPAKDGSSQKTIRTHDYPDSNGTYEAKFIIRDDFGRGFWKTITFKPQSCPETELILKVNNKTNETCFRLYAKDSIFLSVHLPLCLLTSSTRSKWTISRILAQGNSTEYLVTDIISSTIVRDVLNYTMLPFTLEVASYTIEVLVNSEDEFGSIVGLSKASTCVSLELTHLQAVVFARKKDYTINETIIIDATRTRDPDQPFGSSGLEFVWYCSTNNNTKDTNNEYKSTACFIDDSTILGFSGTTLIFPATQLSFTLLPANYFLTVTVRKSGRESASATVQISLVVGDPPLCNISCLYNCNVNIDVYQLLLLQVSCNNCHRTEQLSYSWRLVSSKASNKLAGVSSREVLMEYNTARCAVKAELFSMAHFFEEYQINVRVTRVDGTYSWTSYPVHITTLFGEELSAFASNSSYGYLKVNPGEKESDDVGPLIAIIIGVMAGLVALAGGVYLIKRRSSQKARDASRKAPEGNKEPPSQSAENNEATTSAHTKA